MLREAIQSYLYFTTYDNLIILDNGSDYPPLLQYLQTLENKGVKVMYLSTAFTREERAKLKHNIKEENALRKAKYYIVTDPDIAFINPAKGILDTYVLLLETLKVDVVGPMLTIKDIPKGYPAREFAWKRHVEQFWMYKPKKVVISQKAFFVQHCQIDTTFGIHRAEDDWHRQKFGVRVYSPYEAKHLDWYFTPDNIPKDQVNYMSKTAGVEMTHWSSQFWTKQPSTELPNWLREIWIIENGIPTKWQLPKSSNYIKQLIPSIQIPLTRILRWLGM